MDANLSYLHLVVDKIFLFLEDTQGGNSCFLRLRIFLYLRDICRIYRIRLDVAQSNGHFEYVIYFYWTFEGKRSSILCSLFNLSHSVRER